MTSPVLRPPPTASGLPTALVCAGCGYRAPGRELHLRCPNARPGDDVDHLIRRTIDPARVEWPSGGEVNPFIRYRTLFHWYHVARACGRSDDAIVDEVARLDEAVRRVDGRGFVVTPFARNDELDVWIKNETNNVSGSHKARHLFGTLLALHFMGEDAPGRPLAIASCGNAALAAAVVARAAERELHVFVPVEADPTVVGDLEELGALVTICERGAKESGDPTVLRLREAVAAGAVPFTCQGNENGIAIEGGLTLGYELADALATTPGVATPEHAPPTRLDNLFVQVGGGALASSLIQGLSEARALGVIELLPRMHTVQTVGVAPLARAYRLIRDQLEQGRAATDVLREASRRRSRYMRPWWPVRLSVASGILDDETYDWLAVMRGMLATGGQPLLVDEAALSEANQVARDTTAIDVDPTGSAGLAGLLQLRRSGEVLPTETCAVLFTGVRRS
jgi:threonine synthase